ncbi:aliphatic sulfonate ABC transporter substrate-binding protein [Desulfosarcina ovata subsp. sediminis]|uniref:Aliphatic sulfonate ABC transporter substrate-binding protein n=1 Tax=Desulfosarcina ovata subsp. sediminis TaxID=885957 RepID=A0A5K7ZJE4_9BACT|nr:ABC transporter substrate-binding protein [Desulfosarcina ovata]BBO81116.1 aliphatic sulfonate ABC transporter substrate-binding protein [Desulfosarcina ovata subsp. sediminis]
MLSTQFRHIIRGLWIVCLVTPLSLLMLHQPVMAVDTEPVRLAYGRKIHYAPQILAVKLGYFKDAGVEIDSKILLAGSQNAEALITGAADVAVMGDVPALMAVASGSPVCIVASYGGGENMHRIVVRSGITLTSASDWVGKRIAVQHGSSTHGALLLYLHKYGVNPDHVRIIPLRPTDMPDAMATDQIDATAGSEPWPGNILRRVPGAYALATLSGLGNNYPLMMLVNRKMVESRPDVVIAMLRATDRAIRFMRDRPEKAAEIIGRVTGVAPERELEVLKRLSWQVVLDSKVETSLAQTAAFLTQCCKLRESPKLSNMLDAFFIDAAGLSHGRAAITGFAP